MVAVVADLSRRVRVKSYGFFLECNFRSLIVMHGEQALIDSTKHASHASGGGLRFLPFNPL